MFRRLSNSWELARASANVLSADKELVVFPIVSFVASLLVTATFVLPMILVQGAEQKLTNGPLGIIVGFAFYTTTYFVIFFCNAALIGAALIRLRGGDPTVADGFRIASGKVGLILQYALISATVGMFLRAIQERAGLLGPHRVGPLRHGVEPGHLPRGAGAGQRRGWPARCGQAQHLAAQADLG